LGHGSNSAAHVEKISSKYYLWTEFGRSKAIQGKRSSAANPVTCWKDHIAEEYPKGVPMTSNVAPTGTRTLNDLFGSAE
jgi:hypothetical protein